MDTVTALPGARAFRDEMVAMLRARGRAAATLRLEAVCTRLCEAHQFPLFRAYPRAGSNRNASESIVDIRAHSKVVP